MTQTAELIFITLCAGWTVACVTVLRPYVKGWRMNNLAGASSPDDKIPSASLPYEVNQKCPGVRLGSTIELGNKPSSRPGRISGNRRKHSLAKWLVVNGGIK